MKAHYDRELVIGGTFITIKEIRLNESFVV